MGGICSCVGKKEKPDVAPADKTPDENGEQQNKVEETPQKEQQEEEKAEANGGEATQKQDENDADGANDADAAQMSNDIVNEAVAEASQQHEQEVAAE